MTESHYELIGVEFDASKEEIRGAYRARLEELRVQIESGRSDAAREAAREQTARLNSAWQILSDPFQRRRYDSELELGEDAATEPAEEEPVEETRTRVRARRTREREPAARDRRGREPRPPAGVEAAEAAPVARRLAALLIDVVIVAVLYFGIVALTVALVSTDSLAALIVVLVAIAALLNLYFVVPTARTGQTLGKRLVHNMVVDAETGRLPTPRQVGLRYLVPILLVLSLPVTGTFAPMAALLFGFSWLLVDTRIGLMDRLGHTRVVVARYRPERAA